MSYEYNTTQNNTCPKNISLRKKDFFSCFKIVVKDNICFLQMQILSFFFDGNKQYKIFCFTVLLLAKYHSYKEKTLAKVIVFLKKS